ncbi:outer membrane beta-barrel protein [uncultured Winogradskyella sp.]|uniref:outer membrane beta-barrel protein n=1 Tax=uncultured Winogradskyella sp. TaxID=395353 RepID=UPI0026081A0D|nr:outer membrane beta-barrel protein [uncultured Winogradskyella sp.]
MKRTLILLALIFSAHVFSQQKSFKIEGSLIAEDTKTPLESATVYLQRVKDSSLVTYTITDREGMFLLQDKTYDDFLNLFISYVGYSTYSKKIAIDKENINLGPISLKIDDNALDEVVIKATPPITVKKDTLEFNVASFKTKKDANVEDLLKKLPGVEVDATGAITVNGKPVNKILVNGKPFFGDDPTITTRNLTKEIIDKVQITDTKTKAQAFAGEKGDDENKTINLTIKEENNKGVFGRLSAGTGTDERNEFAGILNLFDNDRRISVLAGGNNINSPNFSFGEIEKMLGGNISSVSVNSSGAFSINGRSFGGGGQGIITSRNAGANYADVLAKGFDVSSDYFYSRSSSENDSRIERENILPDARFFTNSTSRETSDNDNHRFNAAFDIEVDSTFLINITPSFNYVKNQRFNNRFDETFDENQDLTNQSTFESFSDSEVRRFNTDVDITKRFGKNGSFLKFAFETEFSETDGDEFQVSETLITDPNVDDILRNQQRANNSDFNKYRLSSTYRIPLIAKKLFLDAKLSHLSEVRSSQNSTFDFNDATLEYDLFNTDLSSDFKFTNRRTTPSLDLSYRKDKLRVSLEVGYVNRTLENEDALRPALSAKERFNAIELDGNFNYRFSDKASLYSGYSLRNRPPQLRQLQAFQDVSNPLNIIVGNPELSPSNDYNLYAGFNNFDFQKRTGIFLNLSASTTQDEIVTRSTVDENFVRTTTYDNVDGNYRIRGGGSFRKSYKVDSLRTVKLNFGFNGGINRRINFNNDVKYASNNTNFGPRLGVTFNWKDVMEITPTYNLSYNTTRFDLADFDNQEFLTHNLRIRTAMFLPKKFEWRNDINYNYNPNVAVGFQKFAWFWNSTLAYTFLKDKATLTLKAYDILNQNTNARRVATADYIQDSQSTVLQQYFMLSFSWKFNSLGSKGKTNSNSFIILD